MHSASVYLASTLCQTLFQTLLCISEQTDKSRLSKSFHSSVSHTPASVPSTTTMLNAPESPHLEISVG